MKQIIVVFIALLFFSCGNEKTHDFTLKGQVKGLKKGTVYLQRQNDNMDMETIDSLEEIDITYYWDTISTLLQKFTLKDWMKKKPPLTLLDKKQQSLMEYI